MPDGERPWHDPDRRPRRVPRDLRPWGLAACALTAAGTAVGIWAAWPWSAWIVLGLMAACVLWGLA